MRGRVLGTRFTLTQGTYALSVLVGGALAGVVDVRILFVVAGAIVARVGARRPADARGPRVLTPRAAGGATRRRPSLRRRSFRAVIAL